MNWKVTQEDDGCLVRDFIRAHIRLSAKMLKYLKYRNDGILVNGERCTVRRVLRAGDLLTLAMEDTASSEELIPVELPLEILYEDEHMVVPSKPPHMPTHPSHNHHTDTVANALAYRYRAMGVPFVFRPINRLDRDTSGLLLIARNKRAAGLLTTLMQEHRIQKSYLAILEGEMTEDGGVVEKPLHRTAASIIVREICAPETPDAEPARTEYRVLARGNGCTLVAARPITGRTHQLRVHFSDLGHPIAGDTLYGIPNGRMARQALHAHTLSLPHPETGEPLHFRAPIPEDMRRLMEICFPDYDLEKDNLP
ncbi:MAG: RluA family pseudouridine synthase [Ruminococcaceae bacterium]|nr:RluA family pseudouridine synthase [Oscillospiraceae bacterium]